MTLWTACALLAGAVLLLYLYLRFYCGWGALFREDCVRPPKPLVTDKRTRDRVLKQGFSQDKIPPNLDALVIGSGIGGMSAAVLLAKAGKKVLVLEQHDQAGGSCHTFQEHGFEFDVGVHYVGQMHEGGMLRVIMDQLTEGQLQWNLLAPQYESIKIGHKVYHLHAGKREFLDTLKKQFPGEEEAIEKFTALMKTVARHVPFLAILKMMPQWLSLLLVRLGVHHWVSPIYRLVETSHQQVMDSLTSNKELQTVFSYLFYGVPPNDSSFMVNAVLMHHFKRGAWYPRGGSSEIAFHMIPIIERAGGRVLVRAPVSRVLLTNGKATGVAVQRKEEEVLIHAPIIISDAGLFNTYERLLPPEIKAAPEVASLLSRLEYGLGCFLVFVGLRGTSEELGLKSTNLWIYQESDLNIALGKYDLELEQICENLPLMFITFPSAKDPTYQQRHPGHSCMTLLTMAPYRWFSEWSGQTPRQRSEEYHSKKMKLAQYMLDRAIQEFPHLESKIAYVEAATPVSNEYYLRAPQGSMYGAEQNSSRYQCEIISKTRVQMAVPGLYLTAFVGESGYPSLPWLLTPVLHPTTAPEQAYNLAHKKTRVVMERTFGVIKSRFRAVSLSGGFSRITRPHDVLLSAEAALWRYIFLCGLYVSF
ncbi:all-trans-retinol 13,14-reductase-like isoform X2 [Hyperolius riggenbachi]|uniref:all-trans-retinol 13,14-reductase-like isoform X2 n=1 Tax=Hyperolius riggenbachi TaxID=752182 RepID=UPI0035A362E9